MYVSFKLINCFLRIIELKEKLDYEISEHYLWYSISQRICTGGIVRLHNTQPFKTLKIRCDRNSCASTRTSRPNSVGKTGVCRKLSVKLFCFHYFNFV